MSRNEISGQAHMIQATLEALAFASPNSKTQSKRLDLGGTPSLKTCDPEWLTRNPPPLRRMQPNCTWHRAFHPDAGTRPDFRNVNGVFKKLCNFAALNPEHDGAGLLSFSAGDEQTWEEFADDEDALAEAVLAIRSGCDRTPPESVVHGRAARTSRGPADSTFEASKIAGSVGAVRLAASTSGESSFEAYLASEGTQVSALATRPALVSGANATTTGERLTGGEWLSDQSKKVSDGHRSTA